MTETTTSPTKTEKTTAPQELSNGSARSSKETRKMLYRIQSHIDDQGNYNEVVKPLALGYASAKGIGEYQAKQEINAQFQNEFGTDMKGYLEAHREERGLSNDGNGRSR